MSLWWRLSLRAGCRARSARCRELVRSGVCALRCWKLIGGGAARKTGTGIFNSDFFLLLFHLKMCHKVPRGLLLCWGAELSLAAGQGAWGRGCRLLPEPLTGASESRAETPPGVPARRELQLALRLPSASPARGSATRSRREWKLGVLASGSSLSVRLSPNALALSSPRFVLSAVRELSRSSLRL